MAWIAIVPPSPRHPHERYQARYQDGPHQRSAGIYATLRRAEAERRALETARLNQRCAGRVVRFRPGYSSALRASRCCSRPPSNDGAVNGPT
jgi:hypothetical protein